MAEKQEREAFERRHASEVVEIVVLTGERTGGAGKAGGEVLWTPCTDVLAYVDDRGTVVMEKGQLSWLATDGERGSWIHDLKPLTQYIVRVRSARPDPAEHAKYGTPTPDLSHHFALDEVIEREVHIPALDERLSNWLRPVTIATGVGDFELERAFGNFSGGVEWCGAEVTVVLDIDEDSAEGAETCVTALARFEEYIADAVGVDARWRGYAAAKLTDLANDWQQQEDNEEQPEPDPITPETFARRVRLGELSVAEGGSVTAYYDDDEMFWGHAILLDVEPDGTITDAYIAG